MRDGRVVLGLPGGLRWVVEHRPDGYDPPHSFVDELAAGPLSVPRWRHSHLFVEEGPQATRVEDYVGTPVPASLLREMFAYRHRQLAADLASHARIAAVRAERATWASRQPSGQEAKPHGQETKPLTVAVTGSSGLIGSALTAFLSTGGHRVVRLVRRSPKGPDERQWRPEAPGAELFEGMDAVVHLAGASIAGRFSPKHKRVVLDSRVGPTRHLAEAAARAAGQGNGPSCFVAASAIGYYGYDRGDEVLTEVSSQGDGFLADVVAKWEAATAPAAASGLRVVQVRTGIVQSPRGGMLGILYPLFFAGLGGRLGSGRQWTSWVDIDDLVDIYARAIVDPALAGPVNAVSPEPVTNAAYTKVLAQVLRRPALFKVPSLAPQLVLGPEGAREFALAGQRVVPAKLTALGHQFRHRELEPALRHLLGRTVLGD